ncbi:MAG: SMP-30/gluconolactonase/LRE family protein [Bacteroidota bacterium]
MTRFQITSLSILVMTILIVTACSQEDSSSQETSQERTPLTWETVQDSSHRVHNVTGFDGPEAVRYDPDQDVYFVSNFTGEGNDRDANGFISKVTTDGTIDNLRYMTGTEEYPLHAPRGMYITGTTLWAADIDGVHGFDTSTGEQTDFIDFTEFEPGFLNDIVAGADGHLYITDTGEARLYNIEEGVASVVVESLPISPNGITLDPESRQLILAPWNEVMEFHAYNTDEDTLTVFDRAQSGGNFDGIEFYEGRLLSASQVDSSLHVTHDGMDNVVIHTPGRPADIGLDTRRNQVAVPYIARNEVDIWQLP